MSWVLSLLTIFSISQKGNGRMGKILLDKAVIGRVHGGQHLPMEVHKYNQNNGAHPIRWLISL